MRTVFVIYLVILVWNDVYDHLFVGTMDKE